MELEAAQEPLPNVATVGTIFNKGLFNLNNTHSQTQIVRFSDRNHL